MSYYYEYKSDTHNYHYFNHKNVTFCLYKAVATDLL